MAIDNPADRNLLLLLLTLVMRDRSRVYDREELNFLAETLLEDFERNAREYYKSDLSRVPVPILVSQISDFIRSDFYRTGRGSGDRDSEELVSDRFEFVDERIDFLGDRVDEMDLRVNRASSVFDEGAVTSLQQTFGAMKSETDARFSEIERAIAEIKNNLRSTTDRSLSALWGQSLFGEPSLTKLERHVPVQIFSRGNLSDLQRARLESAISDVLKLLDFDPDLQLPGIEGSWYKKMWYKTHSALTSKEVEDRLKKLEKAVETVYIDKPMAEASNIHGDTVSKLIDALKEIDDGCLQVGNVLVIKRSRLVAGTKSAGIAVKTLSALEMYALENNQSLLNDPYTIVDALQASCEEYRSETDSAAVVAKAIDKPKKS